MGILSLAVGSCSGDKSDNNHQEAAKLYTKICNLTALYVDSISQAPDSASVHALLERFEERLDGVNYEVLPDTDYALNEAENDTISMMLDSLGRTRARRLLKLANHPAPADSLARAAAADSLARAAKK